MLTGYIQYLRQFVGTKPLLQCGATVVALDAEDRALMLRRADNGLWCFPGGSVELGERLEDACRRELMEEAGVAAGELSLLNVFSGPELYYQYPNGDEVYNIDVVFLARDIASDVRINEESTAFAFFSLDALPTDISPPQRPIVAYLKGK